MYTTTRLWIHLTTTTHDDDDDDDDGTWNARLNTRCG
jgi:hypothetical protein